MANRHLSRSIAVQSLFEWDFNGCRDSVIDEIISRNIEEFAPGLDEQKFIDELVHGVIGERERLDNIIEKAAPEWPIDKIATVDRNVLRVGLWELLFADRNQVPSRVAINEAIEIAKTYGGENSGKFVNGVLGTVYREMGEPGKNDIPAKKKRIKDIRYEDMPIENLVGAVIYTKLSSGAYKLAFVHDIFGYWTLSKGHVGIGESLEEGARREVKEEISLDLDLQTEIGENEYVASDPKRGKIRKRVTYYLAEAINPKQLHLTKQQGLDDAQWFPLESVLKLKMYDDIVPIVTRALDYIAKFS